MDQQQVTSEAWASVSCRLLKSALKLKGVSYRELSARLARLGIDESESNLSNKINRGRFSAAFMLQVFHAIGMKHISVVDPDSLAIQSEIASD
ncbi:MAG: hypothetical protein HQL49_04955 [Gammaproteobacteria bacterium]|nr:hypothetical protein [Gammaproteobacteria bacterium]